MGMEWKALRFSLCFPRHRRLYYKLVLCTTTTTTRMFRAQFAPPKWIWSGVEKGSTKKNHKPLDKCAEKINCNTRPKGGPEVGGKRVQLATLTKWNRKFRLRSTWGGIVIVYGYIHVWASISPSGLSDWMVYVWHLWPVIEVFSHFDWGFSSTRPYKLNRAIVKALISFGMNLIFKSLNRNPFLEIVPVSGWKCLLPDFRFLLFGRQESRGIHNS